MGGGFEDMFGGGGMGGGRGGQRRQQQQEEQPLFKKNDASGVVPLGKLKFPDSRAKHPWLLFFYDKNARDGATTQYAEQAKILSEKVLKKGKNKNSVIFKVGAVDCSEDMKFCQSKLGKGVKVPAFATVLNGRVSVVDDDETRWSAKQLHEHTTDALLAIEGLVINVNSAQHIETRLLGSSPSPGQTTVAILLFTDKYETSPLYASLAYRHRQDGFVFGESRAKNLQLGKEYGLKKYPLLVALIGDQEKVVRYDGALDSESLSNWLDGLAKKYFKSKPNESQRKKKQQERARS